MEDAQNKKTSLLEKLGNVSDERISFFATAGIFTILMSPALMAAIDMPLVSISLITLLYEDLLINTIFPVVGVIAFILYLLVFLQIRNANTGLWYVIKKNPVFAVFSLAVVWLFVSQFYNGLDYALEGFHDATLMETFDMEFEYFIFILFCATQVRLEKHKRFLVRSQLFFSVFLVIAAFYLWDRQIFSVLFDHWTPRFAAIFSNRNYYGYYLAFSVPLAGASFVHEKKLAWKIIAAISLVVNTIGLAVNDCLGAMLGATAGVLFVIITYLIIYKKINWQPIVMGIAFFIVLIITGHIYGSLEETLSIFGTDMTNILSGDEVAAEEAGSGRWSSWLQAFGIIKDNPLFGIGFEGFLYGDYYGYIRPHNEFIQYAMFYGIPMGILYFAGCFGVFIRALRKKKIMDEPTLICLIAAFGYLVSSFFGITVFNTAMYVFVFLGMGYVRDRSDITIDTSLRATAELVEEK